MKRTRTTDSQVDSSEAPVTPAAKRSQPSLSRFSMAGWLVAAAMGGAWFSSGFQSPSLKLGVVDVNRIVEASDLGKTNAATLKSMKTARENVLEFIDTYRVLTPEQATRIRDLWLKPTRTKEEDAELERIKAEVISSNKRLQELSTKTNLTPEERTLMEEYARRSQMMNEQATRWLREFTDEIQSWIDGAKADSYQKARAAISEVATKDGYNMVFESTVCPYGANDVSEAALAAMNVKK